MKRLENKVAVVYGDGTVGGVIAKAFAREGARLFLTGRTVIKLDAIADEILPGGGAIETAQLDALDEQAVEEHMKTQDYTESTTVNATPQEAFKGINSVTKWWTENFEGSSQKLNDEFILRILSMRKAKLPFAKKG